MKKKWKAALPFLIMPAVTPIYNILDHLVFVDVFGCGCVPEAQTNMLNIAFNANDNRRVVFFLLAIAVSCWSIRFSRNFQNKWVRGIYCAAVIAFNLLLAVWVIKSFLWS